MKAKDFLLLAGGFVAGAAIGTAIGVLAAPESGEDTRRRVEDTVTDLYYDTYDKVVVLSDRVAEEVRTLKETINNKVMEFKREEPMPIEEEILEEAEVEEAVAAEEAEVVEEAEAVEEAQEA